MISIASGKKKDDKPKTKYGYYAVILGLCGFCCCGCILVPLTIYFSRKGMKEDLDPGIAKFGLVLGICGVIWWLVCFIILGIILMSMI